ncbi:MAG TPA: hypothetical protein VKY92_09845, partial [Verrucomicrobiae bacterium]|nr:hypothetical protein [Verrucomicrobiae bacterium]
LQNYRAYNAAAARGIALREVPLKQGQCDYLLLVDRKAVGVVEAKRVGSTLSTVAEQSGYYGANLPEFIQAITPGTLPFLYESTGVKTFFRDDRDPAPRSRRVFSFHRPETLAALASETSTLRKRLAEMPLAHPLAKEGMRQCQFEATASRQFAAKAPLSAGFCSGWVQCVVTCGMPGSTNEIAEVEALGHVQACPPRAVNRRKAWGRWGFD